MWDAFVPVFSKSHRLVAIDLLGHGRSGCAGYIHTMEDQANLVREVLRELKIRKAVFVGHSMGGYVALAFAALFPNMLKGLVLLNATSKADSSERKLNRDRAIVAVKQNHTAFVRMAIANLFSDANRERLSDVIEAVKNEALKTPLQGIIAALEGMKIRADREPLLRTSTFPILLILGKNDSVLDYEDTVKQLLKTNVALVTFPDGHMSHLENEAELKMVLLQFLKQL